MRAHDIGIGLAVAWARARGHLVYSTAAIAIAHDFQQMATYGGDGRYCAWLDRGPIVEPEPLTDMRVAFGIGLARAGATWGHVSTPSAALARAGGQDWSTPVVGLNPRRWVLHDAQVPHKDQIQL